MTDLKRNLIECLERANVLHKAETPKQFVSLASGGLSPYYFELKKATLNPSCLQLIAKLVETELENTEVDAVAGMALGAVPICIATSLKMNIPSIIVRKEPKAHGMANKVEGIINPGDKIAVIDDVTTTGSSILETIEEMKKRGGFIVKVITVVDRLEGAREKLKEKGYELTSILDRRDFGVTDEWIKMMETKKAEA